MFWRDDFLDMPPQETQDLEKPLPKPDIYGALWLIITYIILLSLAANLNDYFGHGAHATTFHLHPEYLTHAVALSVLFRIAEILIYPSVVGCLNGELSSTEVYLNLVSALTSSDTEFFYTLFQPVSAQSLKNSCTPLC
jgi:hypothetical protein